MRIYTLPSHLPRDEVVIDVAHASCPCCGGALHAIGELRTEQLDIVPSQLRVRVTRRPLGNWVGRACWWLTPLYDLVVSMVLGSTRIFAGDTTLPVLDPVEDARSW